MKFFRKYGLEGVHPHALKWHRWFAWRPVLLLCGRAAWLETIFRRRYMMHTFSHPEWEYAAMDDTDAKEGEEWTGGGA